MVHVCHRAFDPGVAASHADLAVVQHVDPGPRAGDTLCLFGMHPVTAGHDRRDASFCGDQLYGLHHLSGLDPSRVSGPG